jgi:hypothetical protein
MVSRSGSEIAKVSDPNGLEGDEAGAHLAGKRRVAPAELFAGALFADVNVNSALGGSDSLFEPSIGGLEVADVPQKIGVAFDAVCDVPCVVVRR